MLEKDSIYTRFFINRSEPSDAEIDRVVNVDFVSEVSMVVTTETVRGETIIASGRYITIDGQSTERSAEMAFVVEEDYQGRGLASAFSLTWRSSPAARASPDSKRTC